MTLPVFSQSAETREATRQARIFLGENVRNDWTFDEHEPSTLRRARRAAAWERHTARGEVAWTLRQYSSSDEAAPSAAAAHEVVRNPEIPRVALHRSVTKSQRQSRLRRRLDQECKSNPGLAHFCAQRDEWTCARPKSPQDDAEASPIDDDSPVTLLPIPQPILQDHPLRARIGKSTYGEIYSKIILQSRKPAIPINLVHVTRALVHGWKEEGNWPPRDSLSEPPMANKKGARDTDLFHRPGPLRKGVQAVGRAFRLGS